MKLYLLNSVIMFAGSQLLTTPVCSQSMSTPYSVYGIGDIDHRNYNMNTGLGYSGLALKTTVFGTGNNPASAAGIEKSFFLINLSTTGRIVTYHGNSIDATNSNNRDFTIKKLSIAAKLTNFWASSLGIQQFSNVNYQFLSSKTVQGGDKTYNITYTGDGGLNEYYWNNAFSIGKHLMIGITGSLIAGSINQTEILTDDAGATIESKRSDYYGSGRLQYGMIYNTNLSKKWQFSIGAKYAAKTKLDYERSLKVVENNIAIVDDEFIEYRKFSLPQSIGGGIAFSNSNGISFTTDYSFDNWSSLNQKGNQWQLVNSSRISGGLEFLKFKKSALGGYQRHGVQFGGFLNNSYLAVNNQQIKEWGITAGLTRLMRGGLMIGASIEGGVRGTTASNLIKENFFQFTLNLSYRDFINSKGRKYN